MPRVGVQLAGDLNKLSTELGHPGAEALWIAAKRRKLAVSKKQVTEYVKQKAEKQVLGLHNEQWESPFRRTTTGG